MKFQATGWRIARIRGIDLRIHASLLILLAYLVLVISMELTQAARAARIPTSLLSGGPVLWAFILSLALFVSIALHEFGHSLFAQSQGVKVRSITLMMLGGVSSIDKIPGPTERRYFEFELAVVGPIVSFVLAGILYGIQRVTRSPDLYFFCYWVGHANFILGFFNLLPAFPLDGGRALRSLIAARKGILKATEISVAVSKVLAITLGIIGILGLNILLLIIAFFVYMSAQAELLFHTTRQLLEGMRTKDVMVHADPVEENELLNDVGDRMLNARTVILPVNTQGDNPAIVSLIDIRRTPRDKWPTTQVKNVMRIASRYLDSESPIGDFISDLAATPLETLPVKENGRTTGYVRYMDLFTLLELKQSSSGHQEAA